jgi:nitrous oxide reductase accessory protein NosL
MRGEIRAAAVLLSLALFVACSREPASGPADVKWDRDVCERCSMVISDRAFAAQVRDADGRVHRFDDPGCAALWLDENGEKVAPREIWVRELAGDDWLDAREAYFVRVANSPMGYGHGAQRAPSQETLDFAQLRQAIRTLEDERRSPGR